MDFSSYRDAPVVMAVDLVNSYDSHTNEDKLTEPSHIETFITTHSGDYCLPFVPTDQHLHEVRALRSRLRDVFESTSTDEAAVRLNSILVDMPATPRISTHGEAPHLHFEPINDGPVRWLGATTAMALSVALVEGGIERFGACDSPACADVYMDTSKNRSRKFCSETCSTRESVAAYRERQRDVLA
jgi:predicted RNA-binding Zn ribbon-like protein